MRKRLVLAITAGLGVLLVAADLVTGAVVEDRLAERLPGCSVDVAGFPVLAQLLAGHLDEVTVERSRSDVHMRLSLSDVAIGADRSVGAVSAVVTMPWQVLSDRLAEGGRQVTVAAEGSRLALTGRRLTVLATVAVSGGELRVEPDAVRVFGQELPFDGLGDAAGLVETPDDMTLPVPALPDGMRLTGAEVTADGLVVRAEGGGDVFAAAGGGSGNGPCGDDKQDDEEGA